MNSLYNYKIKKIIKVVDGDTVDALIDLGFDTFALKRIRLYGINAPETRTRNKEEKEKGLRSKEALKELFKMNDKEVVLKSHGIGKYGRVLGEFFIDSRSVNDFMITEGFASKY